MARAPAFEAETDGVIVRVRPVFIDAESSPEEDKFLWAYHVEIENRGKRTLQLMTRHWKITDSDGRMQEVKGEGVVGKQPVLRPGASFEYTSGCPLTTPSGLMQGAYQFEDEDGGAFEAKIPLFALDSPYDERRPN
ncbi:MAG: Co2+/Mg2+ efflux protein ApaG [Hyphomonadaceae bacterium]|nr:Co2+/Mg2+ efflux protein ApaG [Hyphomonadaceae bacterium]